VLGNDAVEPTVSIRVGKVLGRHDSDRLFVRLLGSAARVGCVMFRREEDGTRPQDLVAAETIQRNERSLGHSEPRRDVLEGLAPANRDLRELAIGLAELADALRGLRTEARRDANGPPRVALLRRTRRRAERKKLGIELLNRALRGPGCEGDRARRDAGID